MGFLESVNVGTAKHTGVKSGISGIDKLPRPDAVPIAVPGFGRSGLAGDAICDTPNHGGPDQAVYAYAREDLEVWAAELGRPLRAGLFGENLTTTGIDVTGAVIGERWQVGDELVLQVTSPRIPCVTFAEQMDEPGWVKRFTRAAVPGAYLRVLVPGAARAGDPVTILDRPDSPATIGVSFRALTLESELLAGLVDAPHLVPEMREWIRRRVPSA
ncbi:MAG TPA: MOSC domain-containing protein [Mycobacteriales bacterium]|nr:MOSC domain-containing protein [Mycobacteriales bacterium]